MLGLEMKSCQEMMTELDQLINDTTNPEYAEVD